eukprot:TRINITY_DN4281_c0_g1_i2.p1 TRINITY_DN4281_c0_g1~~TRINITY_DN4281_c0_g1_i2.p1  ORF type:complete len:549 (+),score=136.55 TRINITY_DN4281_c0_g1_i2:126-1649(+)
MAPQEPKQDLWKSILDDVAAHTSTRHLPERNIVLLGDEGTGKSSLVARLQGKNYDPRDHPMGTGLEYSFLDVTDDDTEETLGRLGVYTLDGNVEHAGLLDFVVTEETVDQVLFAITVDFSQPWTIMDSLKTWIEVVEKSISRLSQSQSGMAIAEDENGVDETAADVGADDDADDAKRAAMQADIDRRENLGNKLTKMKTDLQRFVQAYKEPGIGEDDDDTLPDLDQGVLTHNLGVPLVFIVNKTDAMAALRKEQDYQGQHFDFIQIKLRDLAMAYGAALVYSGRDSDNRETLFRYLVHRAYGLPFKETAQMTRPEALFVPTGWDTPAKVQVLHGDLSTFSANDDYNEVITAPPKREVDEEEITVQDEQEFLRTQHAQAGRVAADGGSRRATLSLGKRGTTRASRNNSASVTRPSLSNTRTATTTSSPSKAAASAAALLGKTTSAGTGSTSHSVPARKASASTTATTTTTTSSTGATPAAAAPGANNDVLASFFNSLLQKPAAGADKK